ncbi:MAG: hypothetical protein U5K69_29030 [Balneolaceae bacterium]|nr:hypothetical protein [Balneolaceae bacterium]
MKKTNILVLALGIVACIFILGFSSPVVQMLSNLLPSRPSLPLLHGPASFPRWLLFSLPWYFARYFLPFSWVSGVGLFWLAI